MAVNYLIFDSQSTGHHPEYIAHIVDFLKDQELHDQYYFVVPEDLREKLPDLVKKTANNKSIHWKYIPNDVLNKLTNLPLSKRSFIELDLVKRYADELSIAHAILLYFNIFQLSLIFKKTKFTISGILFLQFMRMSRDTLKDKIKYLRKYYMTKAFARNNSLKRVFILNDEKTVDYLNREFNTSVFDMLPDPIPQLQPLIGFDIRKNYVIDEKRKIFLHIGSLDHRKGTFDIIDSVQYIPEDVKKGICLLFVGKGNSAIVEEDMMKRIRNATADLDVKLIWDNQFVSNEHMKSLFDQCDTVLMPYKNPEASSGILGHAIASKKKVITTGRGLIMEIVNQYQIGILLDEVSPRAIAKGITRAFYENDRLDSNYGLDAFVKTHHPSSFSQKLLN